MPANFKNVSPTAFLSWPAPNYVDPIRRTWLPTYAIVWVAASTILVFGRLLMRARKVAGTLGLDDLLIFIAWLFAVALSTLAAVCSMHYGTDRHTWDVEITKYPTAALLGWLAQVSFLLSMAATKISIQLFYRRMVKDTYSRAWLYAVWFGLAVNIAATLATFFEFIFICRPLNAYWLAYRYIPRYTHPYTCLNGDALILNAGILTVFTDVYAVLLPCLMLRYYKLDIPRRQLLAMLVIISLGWLATGCGIARTYYLWQMGHENDLTWIAFNLVAWAMAECNIGIICTCAPSMRVFFRRYSSRKQNTQSAETGESYRTLDSGLSGKASWGVELTGVTIQDSTIEKKSIDTTVARRASEDVA